MAENIHTDIADPFQAKLKAILELVVGLVRPRLKTKSQLTRLQDRLVDYHSNQQLADIIEDVLKILAQVLPRPKGSVEEEKPMIEEEQYLKLEQNLQIYQARVRAQIKNEHQLKLYCDDLEAKNKELQESKHDLVMSTKKTILQLKRDNQDLVSQIKELKQREAIITEERYATTPNSTQNVQQPHSINQNSENKALANAYYKNPLAKKLEIEKNQESRSKSKKKIQILEQIDSKQKRKIDQYSSLGGSQSSLSKSRKGSFSSLNPRDNK